MKTMFRWTSALCMLSVSTMASAGSLPPGFTVGYNEAWVEKYGFWLASNPLFGYVPSEFNNGSLWSTMFSGMAQGNAKIVRIWLFPALQGICANPIPSSPSCPHGATGDLVAQDNKKETVVNLSKLFSLVRTYNSLPSTPSPIKLYITALNANDANLATQAQCPALASPSVCQALHTYYQDLFSNSGGATQRYETLVLAPILRLMSQNQDVIYGFDLIDEIEAAIIAGYFPKLADARAWVQDMTKYVTRHAPWLPVTSTAGGGYAVQEVTLGLFSGLGLNFYDVHIYADMGQYSGQTALCFRTKIIDNLPIVLGEYGQKSACTPSGAPSDPCDALQTATTAGFLKGAKSSCFSSALAWKYEALNTSSPWLSYLYITVTGTPPQQQLLLPPCPTPPLPVPGPACARPAYTTIQTFCGQNAC